MRNPTLMAALVLFSGCGSFSRATLFADIPTFELYAEPDEQGTALFAEGYKLSWTEDDLCTGDDGESCENDYFLGFVYYRSDSGAYGDFVEVGTTVDPVWLDEIPRVEESVWRAGILRQKGDESPYLPEASIAAWVEDEVSPDPAR